LKPPTLTLPLSGGGNQKSARRIARIAFPAGTLIFAADSTGKVVPAIESPCIKVCVIEPAAKLCLGCGRSLVEIEHWVAFTPDERRRIMTELPRRLAAQSRPLPVAARAP